MFTKLPNGQIIYEEDYSCIIEPQNGKGGIFIGNLEASQNLKTLKKHGIKAILTAAKGVDLTHSKADIPYYLQIQGEDRDGFDLTRFFPQAISFIGDALQTTSIMVHCLAGVSRSVCLVLAYFIKCKGMSYEEAYRLVKSKRGIIHPNDGFIAQLKKYEREVRSTRTFDESPAHQKGYSASPTKNYQFYFSPDKNSRNYNRIDRRQAEIPTRYDHSRRNIESPSRRNIESHSRRDINSTLTYESPRNYYKYEAQSPSKRPVYDKYNYDIESPVLRRNITTSPTKRYELSNPEPYQATRGDQARRMAQVSEYSHASPQRNREYVPRGRSTSDVNLEIKPRTGTYEKYQHSSTIELSEELDNKIAQIRKKYAEYTQSSLSTKVNRPRETETRVNNYFDENDRRLPEGLGLRKITSDYDHYPSKLGADYSNLGRSSVAGLGLRKLNSMRDPY